MKEFSKLHPPDLFAGRFTNRPLRRENLSNSPLQGRQLFARPERKAEGCSSRNEDFVL